MMHIKVLGPGCANCQATMRLVEQAAAARGVEVALEKVEDMAEIVGYGVMSTPGVIIDEKLVHAGGIPSKAAVAAWFADAAGND